MKAIPGERQMNDDILMLRAIAGGLIFIGLPEKAGVRPRIPAVR
jgi:hypothetical protein